MGTVPTWDLSQTVIMTKIILILVLFVAVLGTIGKASPVRRPARAAEPLDLFGGLLGNRNRGFGGRPNQGLKNHGRTKFWTGAGLWGLGALTNNQGLQNVGGGLAKLGLASKVLAHVPGFGRK